MAYQVLARKWRPQNFSSLVGQEPIVTALRNALAEGRIAHAYLFSGIRGVGKTTAARVLAKALNCERGPAPDPCNECTACVEITRGSDLDVLEVDAATYSKVEQVRELTESLRYGPARDRYKVVVLDEVHRLSRQAFDALLKIVEEPPPHLVFIFATTEIDAVPATILSRCQEFHFRRVGAPAVAGLLREISDRESIAASDSALRLIARAGEGSLRDSVALLDQLSTFGAGTIADEAAVRLLGGLDLSLFRRLLAAILAGDAPTVSREARHVEDEGWDPRHVYGQFLTYCRDALHLALGGDPHQLDLVLEDAQALAEVAHTAGYENLLRLLNQLLLSESTVRRSEVGALAVEISWLRAAELPKMTRVEELLGGARPAAPARPATAPSARPAPANAVAHSDTALHPRTAPPTATHSDTAASIRTAPPPPTAPIGLAPDSATAPNPRTAQAPGAATPAAQSAAAAAAAGRTPPPSAPGVATVQPASTANIAAHHAGTWPAAGPTPAAQAAAATAGPPPQPAPVQRPPASATAALPAAATAAPPAAATAAPPAAAAPATPAAASQAAPAPAGPFAGQIDAFLAEVSARRQPLAAHLEHADYSFEGGQLLVLPPAGDQLLGSRLRQPANREAIAAAVAKVWGAAATWDVSESVAARSTAPNAQLHSPREAAAAPPPPPPSESAAVLNPAVQTLLDIFGGKVEAVEEHRSMREE